MRPIDADALIEFCAERWIPLNIDAVNMQPTIQPEKAQLSCEGTTFDTISRTEVVEHLRRVLDATVPITDYDEGFVDGIEFAISTASTMPPAQSQSTVGQINDNARSTAQSTDLIDRQQAIELIKNYCENGCDIAEDNWCPSCQREQFIELLKVLPPVQPEPHEGHWIPHESPDGGEQYECSRCGVLWEFTDGTPEDNEAYFCPKCGKKLITK